MKTNAVSERGKIKDRFLALDVNIPQEEVKNQRNKQWMLQIQIRVKLCGTQSDSDHNMYIIWLYM